MFINSRRWWWWWLNTDLPGNCFILKCYEMKLKHKGNKTKIFMDAKKNWSKNQVEPIFELKAIPSMYTYVVWIQMNGEHSLRSEYVSKHSFVCIVYPLISFFPLNLHIFSVLQLFFFFEFLWAGFRMVLPTLLPMLSRQWFIALCILKYKGITLYKWYQVSHTFFSIRSLSFVLV